MQPRIFRLQFFLQPMQIDMRGNAGEEFGQVKRFRDVIHAARLKAGDLADVLRERGQKNDRNALRGGVGFQAAAGRKAVRPWHQNIEQNHVRDMLRGNRERVVAVIRDKHGILLLCQRIEQRLQIDRIIVNHQNDRRGSRYKIHHRSLGGAGIPVRAGQILRQMRGDVIADLPHLEGGSVLAERREKRGMPRVLRFNRV